MALQSFVAIAPPGVPSVNAGTAYNTSITVTDVSPAPQFILPANTLVAGSVLSVRAAGVFSNTGTPTLILGVYYGAVAGTLLAATAATTTTTAAANWQWRLEWEGVVKTAGTAGTVHGKGVLWLATSATAFSAIPIPNATPQTAITIDTTTAKAVTVGATWGTSSASNTLTCNYCIVHLEA